MKKTLEYEYPTNKIHCWNCRKMVKCYEQHIADTHAKLCPICNYILDYEVDASISIDQLEK